MKALVIRDYPKGVIGFFVLFYTVGVLGMIYEPTRSFFMSLTPLALLLSSFALALFHRSVFGKKEALVFAAIVIFGYLVEVVGVNTGKIFGVYAYGDTLGLKAWETPFMIGLNWLLLVYTSAAMVQHFNVPRYLQPVVASLLMLGYDFILEPIAPRIDMWEWANDAAPLENFIAWGLVAYIFHTVLLLSRIQIKNSLAIAIFILQILFFAHLYFLPTL